VIVITPVGIVHDGCEIFTVGAGGAIGCSLMIKLVKGDKQPLIFCEIRL
jgi:hypothetical protein